MVSSIVLAEGLGMLADVYGRDQLGSAALDIYADILRDWPDEKFSRICREVARKQAFFPTPAHFIELGGESDDDEAQEAWNRVLRAIKRIGRYESVDFGPAANVAVRALGGWIKLCEVPEDQLRHAQRHFLSTIGTALRGGYPGHDDGPLWGLTALDAQRMGQPPPPPRRCCAESEVHHPPRLPPPANVESKPSGGQRISPKDIKQLINELAANMEK